MSVYESTQVPANIVTAIEKCLAEHMVPVTQDGVTQLVKCNVSKLTEPMVRGYLPEADDIEATALRFFVRCYQAQNKRVSKSELFSSLIEKVMTLVQGITEKQPDSALIMTDDSVVEYFNSVVNGAKEVNELLSKYRGPLEPDNTPEAE